MKTALLLLLLIGTSLFAYTELPFLTFSDATLSVSTKTVVGHIEHNSYSFPILSYGPPSYLGRDHNDSSKTEPVDGELLLIVDDNVIMVSHYFHFMEHLIGIWNFLTYQDPDRIKRILFDFEKPSNDDHKWGGSIFSSHETTRFLLTTLFPNATIGLLSDLPSNLSLKARKIHVSSRTRSHGIPASGYGNMNGSSRFEYHPERLQNMRNLLFDKMGIKMDPPQDFLRITYCKRSTGRMLDAALEKLLLDRIAEETHHPVQVVDFARISFHEQLQTVANTDLFIGIHGNGLTHLLFLPDHASVLEYFQGGESAFFRLFAQLRGLRYYGNCHNRWVTETYRSLENIPPYQDNVTRLDLENTLTLIKTLTDRLQSFWPLCN